MKRTESGALRRSPFFARTYGGFTSAQAAYFRCHVEVRPKLRVLDPMAGQGVQLALLPYEGADVWLSDMNSAALLLAILRHPTLTAHRSEIRRRYNQVISKLGSSSGPIDYIDDWMTGGVVASLARYAATLNIDTSLSPSCENTAFWDQSPFELFAYALPVLAAREITSYQTSDNVTWIKPGGLARVHGVAEAFTTALEAWFAFAEMADAATGHRGELRVRFHDATEKIVNIPKVNVVVTSPPYANRLDYMSLWAPELAVLRRLTSSDTSDLRRTQIGTTVVKDMRPTPEGISELPSRTRDSLEAIRTGSAKASESYYYPFFANYALTLRRALIRAADRLGKNGKFVVFVRDTVRKDVLFETHELVRSVLESNQCALRSKERHVVRQHIGSLRKTSTRGVYGIAQQEWWMVFVRR